MPVLLILLVAFFILFMADKLQTSTAILLGGYVEKNPVQNLIWKWVTVKRPNLYLFVNFLIAVLMLMLGGLVFNVWGIVWTCAYFGALDAGFVYVVVHNAKVLPKVT
jgi:hypothetical protein